jgi:hypothetical protein
VGAPDASPFVTDRDLNALDVRIRLTSRAGNRRATGHRQKKRSFGADLLSSIQQKDVEKPLKIPLGHRDPMRVLDSEAADAIAQ